MNDNLEQYRKRKWNVHEFVKEEHNTYNAAFNEILLIKFPFQPSDK